MKNEKSGLKVVSSRLPPPSPSPNHRVNHSPSPNHRINHSPSPSLYHRPSPSPTHQRSSPSPLHHPPRSSQQSASPPLYSPSGEPLYTAVVKPGRDVRQEEGSSRYRAPRPASSSSPCQRKSVPRALGTSPVGTQVTVEKPLVNTT